MGKLYKKHLDSGSSTHSLVEISGKLDMGLLKHLNLSSPLSHLPLISYRFRHGFELSAFSYYAGFLL